jgi:HAE1 family hydrophobic/amphiphilic exporter-1
MRFYCLLLGLFIAISLNAQQNIRTTRFLADGTELVEAPVFGTGNYFRTHFANTRPRVELMGPARLSDFLLDGHLELSLRGYLELVLANNTEIAIQKLSIESPKNAITRALARFDPTVVASFRATRAATPTSDALAGATTLNQLTQPLNFSYQQTLDTGTSYNVGFSGNRRSTNSTFSNVNPSLSASMNLTVTQPLLRNFGRHANRITVMIAQSRLKSNQYNLENQLLRLLATAELAYWSVIDARENLRVSEEALNLSEALLARSRRELELGAISPLDIYQPEENRANREIFVTQARFRLAQQLDSLRRQLGADLDPDFRHVPLVLTAEVLPPAEEDTIDPEAMVEVAYRMRPDLRSALQNLNVDDLSYESARNALKPDLSLSLNYISAGQGGTVFERTNVFGQQNAIVNTIPGGLGDALNQVFGFDFPTYGFSLNLRLPIRDRRAVADLADAAVSKRMNTLRARSTEQTIRLEVLNAVNQLESSKARVKLAKTSLDFSQKRVDAEQKKYDLGVTTIYFLLDAQNSLAASQSELVTQAAQYRRNVTTMLRVTGQLLEQRGVVVR